MTTGSNSGAGARAGRTVVAVLVTAVAGPIGLWAALVAAATIIGQVLAGFGVIANANLAEALNPAVWLGFNNIAGNGGIIDSLVGGAGAPGGTAGRYVAFMVTGAIAYGCYLGIVASWGWARGSGGSLNSHRSGGEDEAGRGPQLS